MTKTETATHHWTQLTPQAMSQLGLHDVAYVKAALRDDGTEVYSVHSADGTHMADFSDLQVAFAACRQNELEPVSVH